MNNSFIQSIRETPIAILGAGSWGTALAILLANNGQPVRLWSHDAQQVEQMELARTNLRYLPNIPFPTNLQLFSKLEDAIYDTQDVLITVPSRAFSEVLTQIKPHLMRNCRLVWGTKGLTSEHTLLHVEAQRILDHESTPLAVLSGPSFALEVAHCLPTAVTVASTNLNWTQILVARFNNDYFRIYSTNDLIGVQIGGIVKNILAIAAGMIKELHFGANTLSALITRGLVEMKRFGMALGAKPETFYGLACLGDLILSCTDNQSRNRRFGQAIILQGNQQKGYETAIQAIGQVVEGYDNLAAVHALAEKLTIEMPITHEVYQVIYEKKSPLLAIQTLLLRKPKQESD